MVNISDFFPSVADRIKNIGKLKNKKVLITGANGVIGNHLIPTLKDAGADIYIMVFNNIPYSCLPCKDNSIKTYTFKQEHKFDYIIHLAGYGQPRKFSEDKLTTIYLNTTAIFQLFNVLKEGGSFLFASTSEVYSGLEGLVDETMIGTTGPSHPRACYIESKRCGEAIVRAAQDKFNGKITRISLVYGPGVSYYDTRVMSDFIRSSLEKGFISPKGGLDNIRTYCYVKDAITMLLNILLNGKRTVYNVAGAADMRIETLALEIGEMLNVKVQLYRQKDIGDEAAPKWVAASYERYYDEFDGIPITPFKIGLQTTIDWFKYLRGNLE